MLKYKILKTNYSNQITIPLTAGNVDVTNISNEELYNSEVNLIINQEKEAYRCRDNYRFTFNFYDTSFGPNFNKAGFNLPTDLTKNSFKKSIFLIEFYDNLVTKNRIFSNTLSVYPNIKSNKGPNTMMVDGVLNVMSVYEINDSGNEMYYIYNHRSFSNFKNIKIEDGEEYSSMYIKIMFLNAKTGKVQYFIGDTNNATVLNEANFDSDLYYYEIRFYRDYTFSFYQNGIKQTNIYFKELVVKYENF